jgi:uncharacterized protein
MLNPVRQFSQAVVEGLGYYVYRYIDPRNDETFYVGKGQGNRIFDHLFEAEVEKRRSKKVERIRAIWSAGKEIKLIIHRHQFRDEQECAEAEACLIDVFPDALNEIDGLRSRSAGAITISSAVSLYDAPPADIDFPAVLIKINREWTKNVMPTRMSEVDHGKLYQGTRAAWAIDPKKRRHIHHAISVAFGLIREVYKISVWKPATVDAQGNVLKHPDRWLFEGSPDHTKRHLVGKSVAHLQKPGAQNPIAWYEPKSSIGGATDALVNIEGDVKRKRKIAKKTKAARANGLLLEVSAVS